MEIKIGDKYSKSFLIEDKLIIEFAEVTGDKNPIHTNEEYAKNSIFKTRIAHGFLVGSLISSVLGNDFPGQGTIYISQSLKFLKPVFVGDYINVIVEVLEITEKKWLKLKTECLNQHYKPVIIGEAIVIPPPGVILIQSS